MIKVHHAIHLALSICLALGASELVAQSVTIIGGGAEAQRCMTAAELAATLHIASSDDLEDCTFAINNGKPNQRDLAASYCNRGIIKAALERYQEAFEDYGAAIDLMPELPEPYVGRGNIYFLADKLDRAIEDYTKAMDLELGKKHVALLNRGMAYEAQGHLEKAENDYREAIDLAPEWPLVQQKLDRVLTKRQP
jgi:tetratricopeptide (TPR) repeat protein